MFGRKKETDNAPSTADAEAAITKEEILKSLEAIIDPDLHRNIVELGFVQNIRVCGGNVAFNIELTTPACPVKDQMKKAAEDIVGALPGVEQVTIEMTAQTRRPPEIKNLIPGI